MKLGNYAHVSISVHDLKESSRFYEAIGFKTLFGNRDPQPWILMTDGCLNIHLYESYFSSPALHYFSATMDEKIRALYELGIRLEEQTSKDGTRKQHTFLDPSELSVMLMHHDDSDMPKPNGNSHSALGDFGELSINADSLMFSTEFWRKLSFNSVYKSEHPYPWAILSDELFTLGIHQTTMFNAPALTYFATNVAERVEDLKKRKIVFTNEMKNRSGETVGAILNAPDGQLFFLLNGNAKRNADERRDR
jgi:hypothetical protein